VARHSMKTRYGAVQLPWTLRAVSAPATQGRAGSLRASRAPLRASRAPRQAHGRQPSGLPRLTTLPKGGLGKGGGSPAPHNPYTLTRRRRRARVNLCKRILGLAERYLKTHGVRLAHCVAFSNYHWLVSPCLKRTAYFYCAVCALGFSSLIFVRHLPGVHAPDREKEAKCHTTPTGLTADVYDTQILQPLVMDMTEMYRTRDIPGTQEGRPCFANAEKLWLWQQDGWRHQGAAPSLDGMRTLPWAPKCPDLNVVEQAVGDLRDRLHQAPRNTYPTTKAWEDALGEEWMAMANDRDYRSALFTTWESRVQRCKDGGGFKLRI